MSTYVVWGPSLLAVALVVGCGGGDGEIEMAADAGALPLTEPLPLLEFSAEDAVAVASSIWQDAFETEATSALGPAAPLFSDSLPVAAYAAPGVPIEVGCPVSGTVFMVGAIGDPANPGTTVGDTLDVSYVACDMGGGGLFTQLDTGTVSLVVSEVSGEEVRSTLAIEMESAIDGIGTFTTIGTEQLAVTRSGPSTTVNVSSTRLEVDFNGSLYIALDYDLTLVDGGEEVDAPFELDYATTTSNPELAGSYSVQTPTRFKGLSNAHPSEGIMLITGAGDAQIRLTTIDVNLLTIDIDADGDGTFEQDDTVTMTWDEFERVE